MNEKVTRTVRMSALVVMLASSDLSSQDCYEVLHDFVPYPGGTVPNMDTLTAYLGAQGRLIETADGTLYGTAALGGAQGRGTVFKLGPDTGFTLLHSFDGSDGEWPVALVEASDGTLYGATSTTIFRLEPSGALATVHTFAESSYVRALIEGRDGDLYGTRISDPGGQWPEETIFKFEPGGDFSTLHAFSDGRIPMTLVKAGDGFLYGTTRSGTIFRIATDGELESVDTFGNDDENNGSNPTVLIGGRDGNLYGTTFDGGVNGAGTIFKFEPGVGLTTLHSFGGDGGRYPLSLVEGGDGLLYGATWTGTIFRWAPESGLTTLYEVEDPELLMAARDGSLYAMTSENAGPARIFQFEPGGQLTILHTFIGEGGSPNSLIEGRDGNLYGSSGASGEHGDGTIFRIAADGSFSNLHSLDQPERVCLQTQARDGSIYGTLRYGGANELGAVVVLEPDGTFSIVHSFNGNDGAGPQHLTEASDGSLYGTTLQGGESDLGTIFRLENGRSLSTVHFFRGGDGAHPRHLIEASDGSLYGTTSGGGANDLGTVFRLESDGSPTTVHSFGGHDGANPSFLLEAHDNSFYGIAGRRLFKLESDGELTIIYAFGLNDRGFCMSCPQTLIVATDGNLYGHTLQDGANGRGTIMKLGPSGTLTTVHSFSAGVDGGYPTALIEASDGNLYGATAVGGRVAGGVVFRIHLPCATFRRGDCNADGAVDISDAIFSLGSLFLGEGDPVCDDACDSNDDGTVDISDAINTLGALFIGNAIVPLPGMDDCGVDPTNDQIGCRTVPENCP